MTSPAPLAYGQYYHIYTRGNNRQDSFFEDRNYRHFLKLYAKHILPIAAKYAYCLMRNHLHVLIRIRTPEEQPVIEGGQAPKPRNPRQQFGNLLNAYAKAISRAYHRSGSLFETPYGRVPVTDEGHLVHLVTYLHQNPANHDFVDDFRTWPWSSYQAILSQKPTHLERDEVLAWFQGRAAFVDAHRRFVKEAQIASLVVGDLD